MFIATIRINTCNEKLFHLNYPNFLKYFTTHSALTRDFICFTLLWVICVLSVEVKRENKFMKWSVRRLAPLYNTQTLMYITIQSLTNIADKQKNMADTDFYHILEFMSALQVVNWETLHALIYTCNGLDGTNIDDNIL